MAVALALAKMAEMSISMASVISMEKAPVLSIVRTMDIQFIFCADGNAKYVGVCAHAHAHQYNGGGKVVTSALT